jgi:uncharacterized membrane protein
MPTIVVFILAFLFGFFYRLIVKKMAVKTVRGSSKNIGTQDRWYRFGLGVILFILAIITAWNPILLFASGFCFFEAIFSWCGLYAALGKNTCPRA